MPGSRCSARQACRPTLWRRSTTRRAHAVASPDFRRLLDAEAAARQQPAELDAFVRQDIARYAEIVKFTGAT